MNIILNDLKLKSWNIDQNDSKKNSKYFNKVITFLWC